MSLQPCEQLVYTESTMTSTRSLFNADDYVLLKNFLTKEHCAELANELKRLVAENQTVRDCQCPKSESVYGAAVFNSLMKDLAPRFCEVSGKILIPSYSYARLYAPGEELVIHLDKAECEISATITVGFEGNGWPIYIGDEGGKNANKIDMDVGDVVLYRGSKKHHWREEYTEGKWQAQVFLHYQAYPHLR